MGTKPCLKIGMLFVAGLLSAAGCDSTQKNSSSLTKSNTATPAAFPNTSTGTYANNGTMNTRTSTSTMGQGAYPAPTQPGFSSPSPNAQPQYGQTGMTQGSGFAAGTPSNVPSMTQQPSSNMYGNSSGLGSSTLAPVNASGPGLPPTTSGFPSAPPAPSTPMPFPPR